MTEKTTTADGREIDVDALPRPSSAVEIEVERFSTTSWLGVLRLREAKRLSEDAWLVYRQRWRARHGAEHEGLPVWRTLPVETTAERKARDEAAWERIREMDRELHERKRATTRKRASRKAKATTRARRATG